jgi:DNA-binding response OmpR family regulator
VKEKILIIEDEADLAKGLTLNLADEGYDVVWTSNGKDGLRRALAESPDLVLLDIRLPEMDGLSICREIRAKGSNVPVLMLTAKGEETDKVVGLEVGADDYMVKPFSLRELLARIKALLRRASREPDAPGTVVRIGESEVDLSAFFVRTRGKRVELSALETDILKYLISHKNQVVTREALLDKVWGYEKFPTTRTVDNHILKLRKKIEEDPARPKHILSVYGAGYRFIG